MTDADIAEALGARAEIICNEVKRVLVEATGNNALMIWPILAKLTTDAAVYMAEIDPSMKVQILVQLDGMKTLVEGAGRNQGDKPN